ncbi:dinB superfamily protein [bacterium BMS3Bbin02]|nr:dinB superfamily protein [bacterium BMS3Bbin02]
MLALFERIQREFHAVIEGIDPLLLDEPPAPGANSIGWLAWHVTRSHDRNVSELQGREQLWILEGWHTKFSREPDPAETGFGHTPDQAAAFRSPEPEVVLAYHDAVVDMINHYLTHAPPGDLDREVFSPTFGDTRTVQRRLVGVLTDALQHLGQLAYARGILEASRDDFSGPESR